jgi:hypothetical protein
LSSLGTRSDGSFAKRRRAIKMCVAAIAKGGKRPSAVIAGSADTPLMKNS